MHKHEPVQTTVTMWAKADTPAVLDPRSHVRMQVRESLR